MTTSLAKAKAKSAATQMRERGKRVQRKVGVVGTGGLREACSDICQRISRLGQMD